MVSATSCSTAALAAHSPGRRYVPAIRLAARVSSRSTVSPVLRQAAPLASASGPRALPGLAERGGEGIDAEGEIVGERAQQRGLAGAGAAHAARDGPQQLGAALGRGRLAEDMEPVADLHLLDFAEIAIELAERVVAAVGGLDAAILVEPGRRGKLQDARAQGWTPARIDRGGVEELVDQALQLLQRAVAAGAGERRGQMVDDHGRAAPLGLAALAGVVHDEGIDVRERPERGLRKHSAESASALPGSHSTLPCLPTWTTAWASRPARSQA